MPAETWCVVAVALLAVAIRVPGAIRDAFWQDEVASAHVLIQTTPWGMLKQVGRTEATPPLWYAGGWLLHLIGLPVQAYRVVSVLGGGVLAGSTVLVARRLLSLWAATAAGLLIAFGWQFVMHGRELRAYETFAALTMVFVALVLRETESSPRGRWRRWGLPALTAMAALSNYFFLLSAGATLLWLWRDPHVAPRAALVRRRILFGLAPLLLWSPVLVHQFLGQRFTWIGPFTPAGFVDTYWELFLKTLPSFGGLLVPLILFGLVGLASGLMARRSSLGRLCALLAVGPVLVTALAWIAGAHVYDPRNLIAVGPFAAIALAGLLDRAPRMINLGASAVAVVALLALSVTWEAVPPTPYDSVAHELVALGWRPSDPILLFSGFDDYFAYRGPVEWYLPHDPYLTLGEPTGDARCAALFVIAPGPYAGQVTASGALGAQERVAGIVVGRLRAQSVPDGPLWHASHILVGVTEPSCVRLIPENKIISTLEGS